MITATNLKNGTTFLYEGKPYKVIKYSHTKIGRGGATVRVSARNLETGNLEEKTFNSTVKFDEVSTHKRMLQFLYSDGINTVFMDPKNYEQIEVPLLIVKDELPYIREGEEANVLFLDDRPLSIDIPPKVVLTIKDTPPGVKGNSATNIYKPAEMENGLLVKVPLFINKGDKIRVDTRTGEYLERAK
jgi:elongation factor P